MSDRPRIYDAILREHFSRWRQLLPASGHFQRQLKAPHAFQVVFALPFVAANPFDIHEPVVVPARTFLRRIHSERRSRRRESAQISSPIKPAIALPQRVTQR